MVAPRKILITAGPTREPIDAVRFIGNRSSGAMGIALAVAAVEAGHDVTLLMGPGPRDEDLPTNCRAFRFESSAELKQLLEAHFKNCDTLIMAAAVADYRPVTVIEGKTPREAGKTLTIELQPTPDLVAMCASRKREDQRIIAFALEESAVMEKRAVEKMKRKQVDAIVANPLGTMESDDITALLLTADGGRREPGRMAKADFAKWLIKQI